MSASALERHGWHGEQRRGAVRCSAVQRCSALVFLWPLREEAMGVRGCGRALPQMGRWCDCARTWVLHVLSCWWRSARARGRGATVQAAMEHKARDPDRRDPRARCEVHVDRRWESRRGDHEAVGSEILRRVTVSAVARRVGGGGDARRPASDQQATPASEASRGTAARVRAWRGRRRGDRAGTRPRRRRGSTRRTYAADDRTGTVFA